MPLRWNDESPIATTQIGGGPWIISKHSKNIAAACRLHQLGDELPVVKDKAPGYSAVDLSASPLDPRAYRFGKVLEFLDV